MRFAIFIQTDLSAQQGFGIFQIVGHGAARRCRVSAGDELVDVLVMGAMVLQAVYEGENVVAPFCQGVVHHPHGALDGCVVGCLGDGVVEFDLRADKFFGIVNGSSHADERGAHSFAVGRRSTACCESRCCRFEDLPELIKFEILDFPKKQHPTEVATDHAAEAGLQVSAVAWA